MISILSAVWLQWWVVSNAQDPNNRVGYWLGVYGGLAALALVTNVIADGYVNRSLGQCRLLSLP